eukprot:4027992-Pyramimonas_sp.AAC.1
MEPRGEKRHGEDLSSAQEQMEALRQECPGIHDQVWTLVKNKSGKSAKKGRGAQQSSGGHYPRPKPPGTASSSSAGPHGRGQ